MTVKQDLRRRMVVQCWLHIGDTTMAGFKGWMKDMAAFKEEMAEEDAAALRALAAAKAANANGFAARALAARMERSA